MFEIEVPEELLFTPIQTFAKYSFDDGKTFVPGPNPFFETHLTASTNDSSTSIPRLTYAWGLHTPSILHKDTAEWELPSSICLEIGLWMEGDTFEFEGNDQSTENKKNQVILSRAPFCLNIPLLEDDGNDEQEENILVSFVEPASAATLWCNSLHGHDDDEYLQCRFNMHLVYKLRPKFSAMHTIQAGGIYQFPLLSKVHQTKEKRGQQSYMIRKGSRTWREGKEEEAKKINDEEESTWNDTGSTFWEHQFNSVTDEETNESSIYQTFQSGVDEKFIIKTKELKELVQNEKNLMVQSKLWAKIDNSDLYLHNQNDEENEMVWSSIVNLKVCLQQLEPFHTPYCPSHFSN
jgi:hypothetical protein